MKEFLIIRLPFMKTNWQIYSKKRFAELKSDLKKLEQLGIIEYHPQKEKPQIQFFKTG